MSLACSFPARFCGALWILSLFSPLLSRGGDGFDSAGPLHSAYRLTLSAGTGEDYLGPLYSSEDRGDEREWGVHPFFWFSTNSAIDSVEWDFAYPLMTYHRFGTQSQWQFLELFSLAGGRDLDAKNARRATLFPFYFQQRSEETNLNYTAVVPFYGTLKNRLFYDEIHFVLFPAYAQTRKRDVVTDNYLMPLFHLRHGDALSGWQFWPLVGDEVKGETSRTNSFGGVETEGPYKKFFAAWPLFFEEKTGIGTTNWQDLHFFLPFYLVIRSKDHDTTSCLWPFFTGIDNRALRYREYGFLWPLFTVARGEGKKTTRVFPLFSRAQNAEQLSRFFLWPLYKYNSTLSPPLDRRQTRVLFYLYNDLSQKNLATDQTRRRLDLWPFFSWRHELDGRERLQILSIIEPVLPDNRGIAKNYPPLYALWRSEKNPATGAASESLLWNLYRRETTAKTKKCSFLFGLFQYEMGAQGSRWRLFYVPLGKKPPLAPPEAARPAK
jgi:hypothetical protein